RKMRTNKYEINYKTTKPKMIEIEDMVFHTIYRLHEFAVARGFDGTHETLRGRLNRGIDRIADLIKPVDKNMQEISMSNIAREREEIRNACKALDARKAEINKKLKQQ